MLWNHAFIALLTPKAELSYSHPCTGLHVDEWQCNVTLTVSALKWMGGFDSSRMCVIIWSAPFRLLLCETLQVWSHFFSSLWLPELVALLTRLFFYRPCLGRWENFSGHSVNKERIWQGVMLKCDILDEQDWSGLTGCPVKEGEEEVVEEEVAAALGCWQLSVWQTALFSFHPARFTQLLSDGYYH